MITQSESKSKRATTPQAMTNPKERRLKEKLELRDFKLDALLKVTQAIQAQPSEEDLMARYVDALKVNLGIDRLVLYAADLDGDKWQLLVAAGTDGPEGLGLNQRPSSRALTSTRLGWLVRWEATNTLRMWWCPSTKTTKPLRSSWQATPPTTTEA